MRQLLLILLVLFCLQLSAQDNRTEKLMQQGKDLLRKEKYEDAEKAFKKVFSSKDALPDELCFYYGVTLVKLNKLVKGREFLEKYLSLTKQKGEFATETKKLLAEIDKNVCGICKGNNYFWVDDTCSVCLGKGYTTDNCHACHGKDKVVCPTCKGAKVLVTTNGLGTWYNDCPRCEDGTVTCMRCKGSKLEQHTCKKCKGKGTEKIKKVCTHQH